MVEGVKENHKISSGDGKLDPDEFSRRVRQFAIDARRILNCPDSPIDEVIELHGRVWTLLHEAPGAHSSGIRRWLLAARRTIGQRLQSWAAEDLESLVA